MQLLIFPRLYAASRAYQDCLLFQTSGHSWLVSSSWLTACPFPVSESLLPGELVHILCLCSWFFLPCMLLYWISPCVRQTMSRLSVILTLFSRRLSGAFSDLQIHWRLTVQARSRQKDGTSPNAYSQTGKDLLITALVINSRNNTSMKHSREYH